MAVLTERFTVMFSTVEIPWLPTIKAEISIPETRTAVLMEMEINRARKILLRDIPVIPRES